MLSDESEGEGIVDVRIERMTDPGVRTRLDDPLILATLDRRNMDKFRLVQMK